MTIEVREVSGFDQVRFKGPGILKISQRDEESLTIHAPFYVMKDIESDVVGKELTVGYRSPKVVMLKVHREIISFSLSVKDLRKLRVTGLGRVVIPDLDNDHVRLELSGLGQLILEHLTADRLEVKVSGAGQVRVVGDVEAQSVLISGAGHYDAPRLVSDFAQVKISGAGLADISVSTDLDVSISGAGRVTYAGYPEIVKRISGPGSVTRRRRASRQPENGEDHG